LRLLLTGMAYDNLMQGLGHWFIASSWYEPANIPRFLLHATVLPFLTLFALSVMRSAGVGLARKPVFTALCWLFTLLALAWGLYHEVFQLELEPRAVLGVDKLVSTSGLPPVATILTNIVILPMAFGVWRADGWHWFLSGALVIFILNGATGSQPWGFVVGNFAEVVFVLSLLATDSHYSRAKARLL
jgi:hypothetical protein